MHSEEDEHLPSEIVLVTVSGEDKPGLMAMLTSTLASYQAQVLDIGQAVIHEELALGLLVRIPSQDDVALIQQALAALATEVGSNVRFTKVSKARYRDWANSSGEPRYIITLLTRGHASEALHAVSTITHRHGLNIDTVRRLSGRVPLANTVTDEKICLELRVRASRAHRGVSGAPEKLNAELMEASAELAFDFSVHEDDVFRRNRRLVAFDMDSTLIDAEVMDELAARHGVGEAVSAITARAMCGELDFQTSFRARAELLKGMPVEILEDVAECVELNEGADRLIRALRHFGYRTAIISGGFQYVGERLQNRLGIDYVFANELVVENGRMTGEVAGEIVDAERKAELLKNIADSEGMLLEQTIAIGDGANDLPMLSAAGLGVAYHAKPLVKQTANHSISNFGLDSVLYLMGFSDRDIEQALRVPFSRPGPGDQPSSVLKS
ncbi:MAG: phosphoserine phosphatase SerB [Gammaproteobacteria bacterium]|nr:phosphoserine phosphatase SerB [Gammaproteobacteria bacterium]